MFNVDTFFTILKLFCNIAAASAEVSMKYIHIYAERKENPHFRFLVVEKRRKEQLQNKESQKRGHY